MLNYTEANLNSASYRLGYRPQPQTPAQRIARLERYIERCGAWGSWTETYKDAERELAELKAGER